MQNHTINAPAIQAIGTAVPPHRISQDLHYTILESANGMSREQKLVLKKIYSHSGIEYRHSVLDEFALADNDTHLLFHPSGKYEPASVSQRMELYEQHAAALCKEAAAACFHQLPSLQRTNITHLITFSCTGMYAPGLDIQLVELCGLSRNTERTCINFMGCYAAINALKAAYHICRSQPDAVVMIAGVELCSLHYQHSHEPNQVVANALFGDGSAVAIISSRDMRTHDYHPALALQHFYAEFEQSASTDMVWRIGNHGFDLRLTPEVPHIVREHIAPLIEKLFARAGLCREDISYYALHPGGTRILEACEQALGIDKEANRYSYEVLRNYGNMSSVTVLFVLSQYLQQLQETDEGKRILACAFGPGITMESMIVQIV